MEKVLDAGAGDNLRAVEEDDVPTLDAVAREGARRMLETALEAEVARYVEAHEEARGADGRRLVVRNGRAQARTVTCGAGTLEVRAPRVNDRRVDDDGERQRFTSRILPPYMRRSPKVAPLRPNPDVAETDGVVVVWHGRPGSRNRRSRRGRSVIRSR